MGKPSTEKQRSSCKEPENFFWESELYYKPFFKRKKNKFFHYYDNFNLFNYIFFYWVHKWIKHISKEYVEPHKLHPLPVSDQILHWQPIFSKHVSDGLVRLDAYHAYKTLGGGNKVKRPYRSIFLRALFLTIWKRALVLVLGLIAVNVLSMSIAILVKKLLEILNDKSFGFINTLLLLAAIIACQIADGLFLENISFCFFRMIYIVHYLFSITTIQHGVLHRRKYFNDVEGSNPLNTCNQVLHSCAPDSECSKNPLFCPALRYQNKEIIPQIFNFEIIDSYNISLFFESIKYIIEFLSNIIYGVFLMSFQIKVNIWLLYTVGLSFTFVMILIEVLNTVTLKFVLNLRDYKVSKCNDIFSCFPLVKKMLYDDIAVNIITQCRNNELSLFLVRTLITYFNLTLYISCINISFLIIQKYFVQSVNDAAVVTDIDTAGFMTSFYIFLRIITTMFLVPGYIRLFGMSYVSFKRMDGYIRDCSPNFYISDNKYTGVTKASINVVDSTSQLPADAIVYFKDATFAWVNSREDLLNKNYEPYLKNINFELKRGQMVVITGYQGSGKYNFIKSMLGEMTLVGGAAAVVPLYTDMPIFYASQDIWLQHGTIRSNIVFGHKFDEELYNQVLKAVELEYDIASWEDRDLRVVSDNAPSLSGGQRVRMEMARAVYAYLVFHKVNQEYNEGRCSFLMLLDSSFHGLDPYVSKTIFNNLFNLYTGLLMNDDLSVVLTSTKRSINTCLASSDLKQLPDPPIYNIKNATLKFFSNLHDFIRMKNQANDDHKYLSSEDDLQSIDSFDAQMFSLCSSGSNSRSGRRLVTESKYNKSFKSYSKDELAGVKLNPYKIYMTPALGIFLIFILLTIAHSSMDCVKYVFATNLSDYITKSINSFKDGASVNLSEIKTRSNFSLRLTILFVTTIISLSFMSTLSMASACVVSSRKIHEYFVNSIFKNSSSVIKIKKHISQVMTYISCDMYVVDEEVGYYLSLCFTYLIQTLVNIVTTSYLVPLSIPFIITSLLVVYFYVLKRYVDSSKNIHFAYLETCGHLNSECENAISGSSIYRSFKRESELIDNIIEHRDYKARSKYLIYCVVTWSSMLFNWIFSLTTLAFLVLLIILDKFAKFKLKVGYFGLGLSLCMNVVKSFNKFSSIFSKFEIAICSVERFRYFIPPGQRLVFSTVLNTHEEYVVNPRHKTITEVDKSQLLKRRAIEFKADNRKFYGLRRLFFHPKINVLDVGNYLSEEHYGVELKDVCVYTTPDLNPGFMILKDFNVSAQKSDIIGMVGRTGAGKTTLLSVLQNIVANRTGRVILDGKDLNDIPKPVLRQIIGVLPQLPFVFKGWTIRRFLDPRKLFTDDDINRALDQCGLLKFVDDLHGGKKLDTVIMPETLGLGSSKSKVKFKSVNQQVKPNSQEKETSLDLSKPLYESDMVLSNTQLRTLWLARLMLYRHFYRMIVVDEPPEEELGDDRSARADDLGVPIYELLKKYFSHCTTFLTAHDASVLKSCTSVWVIHDGSLLGTYKTGDIAENESIAKIIKESVKYSLS